MTLYNELLYCVQKVGHRIAEKNAASLKFIMIRGFLEVPGHLNVLSALLLSN